MTSTFIPSTELKDLSTVELKSKFFQISADVERLRQKCGQLPMAEAATARRTVDSGGCAVSCAVPSSVIPCVFHDSTRFKPWSMPHFRVYLGPVVDSRLVNCE